MAQAPYSLDNQPGALFRAALNAALAAVLSNNAGPTAPASTAPFSSWLDTSQAEPVWRQRNAADDGWIDIAVLTASGGLRILNSVLYAPDNNDLEDDPLGLALRKNVAAAISAQAPLGTVAFFHRNSLAPGYLPPRRLVLSRTGIYSDLWNLVRNNWRLYDSNGNDVTRYGPGNGSTTFQNPDWRGRFFRTTFNDGTIGDAQGDAMRNLQGTLFRNFVQSGSSANGVFRSHDDRTAGLQGGTTFDKRDRRITFDASRVVPIGSEFRPVNIQLHVGIRSTL